MASNDSTGPTERVLAERYRLGARKGTGIDVAVFDAHDLGLGRQVVVKLVHPDICALPGFDDEFRATMQRAASIDHPNVGRVLDWGTADWNSRPVQFVVSDVLAGGSLRDLLDRGRSLSPSQAVVVGLDACRGLDVVHRVGLVHGDVRPATLVFGDDGRLRVIDLGLAGLVAERMWADPSGVAIDRARYASPEHATNQPIEARSDVYSLALTLLETITGSVPFAGDSTVATLANRVDRLMSVSADLGPLAAVLERAGRPHVEDRSTAAELGRGLVAAAEKLPRPTPLALATAGLFASIPPLPTPAAAPPPSPDPTSGIPLTVAAAAAAGTVGASGLAASGLGAPPSIVAAPGVVGPAGAPSISGDWSVAAAVPTSPLTSTVTITPAMGDTIASVAVPGAVRSGASPAPSSGRTEVYPVVPPPPPPDVSAPILRVPRSRRKLLVVIALVLFAAGIGGGVAWWFLRDQRHAVPQLVGLERGQALNQISTFGWKTTIVDQASDSVASGVVISTDPASGAQLGDGAAFQIVVSSGPAPRALPELKGVTYEQATAMLSQLGLVATVAKQVNDETAPPGVVVSWSVPVQPGLVAGNTVVKGTTVAVVLSAGPAQRTVPDLTGLSLADATAKLQALGLQIAQLPDEFSDKVPAGGVASQDLAAGKLVDRGATISVALSKGQDLVTVPALASLTVQQVTDALAAAGLKLGKVKGDPAGLAVLAEVKGQSIAADVQLPRGTAVDVTFQVPPPPSTTTTTTTTTVDPNATSTTTAG